MARAFPDFWQGILERKGPSPVPAMLPENPICSYLYSVSLSHGYSFGVGKCGSDERFLS